MVDGPPSRTPQLRTSVRLSLQYTFLYAVLSACVFVMAYFFTQYEVQGWARDQMKGDARTLRGVFETDGAEGLIETINTLAMVSFENARVYQLQDPSGRTVAGNIAGDLPNPLPRLINADDLSLARPQDVEVDVYWMQSYTVGPFELIQGTGDHLVAELLEALGWALVLGYLLVILLGLIVGVRVGRITEARIITISETLEKVASGDLTARVPNFASTSDDFGRVSRDINVMLDQIARLLESQQQISNDIAHDLRTPLQRLRQRLERMAEEKTPDTSAVHGALLQTEDIISTFNSLLRIAQIEAKQRHESFSPLDLAQVLSTVAEVFAPSGEDHGMTFDVATGADALTVIGDRHLLTQLFSNLVENAIKHCPAGTRVRITGERQAGHVVARISDNGPGIDAADRERIFRRFFRVERSRNSPGNGLGLALVKAIADVHGATITVTDANPGTVFEIRFAPRS